MQKQSKQSSLTNCHSSEINRPTMGHTNYKHLNENIFYQQLNQFFIQGK